MENQTQILKLLQDFKSGQEDALDSIFDAYRNLVTAIARRYFLLGAQQEDLVQEGMIGLYKACLSYTPSCGASFKSFAYLCIKRQIQSAVKAANRQKNFALNTALSIDSKNGIVFINPETAGEGEKLLYLPPLQISPEHEIINQETYDELLAKIKKSLSAFEYKVLELYLDGYRTAQIATLTGSAYKTIDNALYRLKQKLEFLNQ